MDQPRYHIQKKCMKGEVRFAVHFCHAEMVRHHAKKTKWKTNPSFNPLNALGSFFPRSFAKSLVEPCCAYNVGVGSRFLPRFEEHFKRTLLTCQRVGASSVNLNVLIVTHAITIFSNVFHRYLGEA